ncbi:MAG: substrate-binding domain-containing protein [Ignavibacteriaceae bacterium]
MKFYKLYILAAILFFTVSGYAQVAIIANKSVSDGSVSVSKLTDIYSLRAKAWSNGNAIILFTHKSDNASTGKFFSAIGKSSADMKKVWMKLQLTGEGQAPEALGSDDEVLNKVASTPGAIGFVDAGKVNDKVKVLLTIN